MALEEIFFELPPARFCGSATTSDSTCSKNADNSGSFSSVAEVARSPVGQTRLRHNVRCWFFV